MAKGFIPNSFQCPNAYVDEFMRYLTGDEFKVLTVVVRQTFGWQKNKDAISGSLMASFTGLSRTAAGVACDSLCKLGLLNMVAGNDPATNVGNVYAPCLDSNKIDMAALGKRLEERKQNGKKRIAKARASGTTLGSGTTAPPASPTDTPPASGTGNPCQWDWQPPASGTGTQKQGETQSETQGASADAAPAVVTYQAKDVGSMTTTNKTFVDVQMDWIEKNDPNVRRLRTHAKSEVALAACLEFYKASSINVLPHGVKGRLAGGQALYEACKGDLSLIKIAYDQLKASDAFVADEWSLLKTVNVLASQKPAASAGPTNYEWVTTPKGKVLRYEGQPYPGAAGRQKCEELGIAYEGN